MEAGRQVNVLAERQTDKDTDRRTIRQKRTINATNDDNWTSIK